jgi:putative colanic acid biosynthesis UDP-glucose lipid carrier transferase
MLTSIDVRRFQPELKQEIYVKQEKSYVFWKRCFDLLIAGLVTLFILVWLIPILGLLIMIESRGPVIFIQVRTGQNGRRFRCLKFRTMTYERNAVFKQVVHEDTRVTRIGKYLRKSNIDELPQFLNVLVGSMSIVGPRPHAIDHDAKYWHKLPNYPKRYSVRPGITGLAQVRGARGITEQNSKMQDRLRYDLFYIRKRTLWQDLQICWWTLKAMYKGDENAC